MKDWTDAEISRRLALAIGLPDFMILEEGSLVWIAEGTCTHGKLFDYRDPAIIWPIAEQFDCFPAKTPWYEPDRSWSAFFGDSWNFDLTEYVETDTAAKAVALAVIKAKEKQDTTIPLEPIKTPLQGVF